MDLDNLWRISQAVFGIGLVIFVHEAGHFIAARLCRVRVEVFSLGFGPRLFGWRRGATVYQIALVPLGGFVKMAGEEIGSPSPSSSDRAYGDELNEKSVGQRFFIYSGGVIMNVLFGLIVFPLVFFAGVPVVSPVISPIEGTPAWHARIPDGSRVLSINGHEIFDFIHIPTEVALAGSRKTELEIVTPGSETPRKVELEPEYSEVSGIFQVGIAPARDRDGRLIVEPGGPAEECGLRDGDKLVAVGGVSQELPLSDQLSYALRGRGTVDLVVERDGSEVPIKVTPGLEELQGDGKKIGVEPITNFVRDVRSGEAASALAIQAGDVLRRVQGQPVERPGDVLEALLGSNGDEVRVDVLRDGSVVELVAAGLDEKARVALASDLFVTQDPGSNQVVVREDSAAGRAGMLDGDRIVEVGGERVTEWNEIPDVVRRAALASDTLGVSVLRQAEDGTSEVIELEVVPGPLELVHYGFALPIQRSVYQVDNFPDAIRAGSTASWRFMVQVWLTLRGIASQEVSATNIGGIITIAAVSHSWASEGWAKLFFFLCLLSMNLAVLNVLPIPVLDGGHLFFLIVEKIKGSPVSERTLGYSQVVGLVLIVSLMVYVTYNDVVRWFLT